MNASFKYAARPPFGRMTDDMRAIIARHVKGKRVWDFGAGNLWHSHMLLSLGATQVTAVEKNLTPHLQHRDIRVKNILFQDVPVPDEGFDVAYVSWPTNHDRDTGLVRLLSWSTTIIYVGCNTNHTACGGRTMMSYLTTRTVLDHLPIEANTLAVYGDWSPTPRRLLPEEWAALHYGRLWTLEEATRATNAAPAPV